MKIWGRDDIWDRATVARKVQIRALVIYKFDFVLSDRESRLDYASTVAAKALRRVLAKLASTNFSEALKNASIFVSRLVSDHPVTLPHKKAITDIFRGCCPLGWSCCCHIPMLNDVFVCEKRGVASYAGVELVPRDFCVHWFSFFAGDLVLCTPIKKTVDLDTCVSVSDWWVRNRKNQVRGIVSLNGFDLLLKYTTHSDWIIFLFYQVEFFLLLLLRFVTLLRCDQTFAWLWLVCFGAALPRL